MMEKLFSYEAVTLLPHPALIPSGCKLPENFPCCCVPHEKLYRAATEHINAFPNCCKVHEELAKQSTFNRKTYEGLAIDILKKGVYTEYQLCKSIDETNWYKDITNYIDYIILSLGSYTVGAHLYIARLKDYINYRMSEMGEHKAQALLDYIDSLAITADEVAKPFDLNVIWTTYQKWLNTFPFELSPFKDLKARFVRRLPILAEEPVYNPYTGLLKARVITKKELIKTLVDITQRLILSINTPDSNNSRYRSDIDQKRRELLCEAHRIKQNELVYTFSKGESQYVKIVKKWLSNEENFIKSIASLPGEVSQSTPIAATPDPLPPTEADLVNAFNKMPLPEAKAWFRPLTTRISKNGKPFLTAIELNQFIDRAFLKNPEVPKLRLSYAPKEKMAIWKLFYLYYEHCTSLESGIERGIQCRDTYIKLLTDNFTNFSFAEVKANFPKSKRINWDWDLPL